MTDKKWPDLTTEECEELSSEFEEMLWMHAPHIDAEWESLAWNACLPVAITTIQKERQRIKDIIVGMRKEAMDQHDYGLLLSHSRRKADVLRNVLIVTGLADDDMVAEHEADIQAIRECVAAISAEIEIEEPRNDTE